MSQLPLEGTMWLESGFYALDKLDYLAELHTYKVSLLKLERLIESKAISRRLSITNHEDLIIGELIKVIISFDRYRKKHNLRKDRVKPSANRLAEYTIQSVYKLTRLTGKQVSIEALDYMGYTPEEPIESQGDLKALALDILKSDRKRLYRRKDSADNAIALLEGEELDKRTTYRVINSVRGHLERPVYPKEELSLFEEESNRGRY